MKPHPAAELSGAPAVKVGLESNWVVHPLNFHTDPDFTNPVTGTLPSNHTASRGYDWTVSTLLDGIFTAS